MDVLNGTGTFQFSLDMDAFERFAAKTGDHPRTLLFPLTTEVKLKLDGEYWRGYDVVAVQPFLNETGATLSVRCTSYLDRLTKRYLTTSFAATESTAIATGLITQANAISTTGITIGATQYDTDVDRDRVYSRKEVADAIRNLTNLTDGKFDFWFTWDRKFETYEMLGSLRADTPLVYGDGGNITRLDVPTEGSAVENYIIGLGAGFGADQAMSPATSDSTSIATYMRREAFPQFNDVSVQQTLNDHTAGYLAQRKQPIQIPNITVSSAIVDLASTMPGDRFSVDLSAYQWTDNITGLYRLIKCMSTFDENDVAEMTLTFDNLGVNQSESL